MKTEVGRRVEKAGSLEPSHGIIYKNVLIYQDLSSAHSAILETPLK